MPTRRSALPIVPLVALLIACAAPAMGQGVDAMPRGNGTRALAMGFAFTAAADDATAATWNPAAMTRLGAREIAVTGRGRVMTVSEQLEHPALVKLDNPVTSAWEPVTFAGAVQPLGTRRRAAVGLAWRELYDWERFHSSRRIYEDGEARVQERVAGGIRAASLALAVKPADWGSFGVMVSALDGRVARRSVMTSEGTVWYEFPWEGRVETADYRGTPVELGALLEPAPTVSIGLTVSLPYTRRSISTLTGGAQIRNELALPATFALGTAMQLTPRNRLAVDVRHAPLTYASSSGGGSYSPFDLTSLHLGFEHRRPVLGAVQSFMAGAYTHQTMDTDARDERVGGLGFSLGTSRPLAGFLELDAAASYLRFSKRDLAGEATGFSWQLREHELALSLGVRLRT